VSQSSYDLNGILNIEPLPAPQINWEPLLFSTLGLLAILVVAIIFYTRYRSTRGITKHKLRILHIKFKKQQISSHDTAFQLASIMQQGLRLHALSHATRLPKQLEAHQARWNTFIQNLCNARYSSHEYSKNEMQLLFSDVKFFVGQWR